MPGATRVLGIDPGLRVTGYAVVKGDGTDAELVEAGVIRLVPSRLETPPIAARLCELERDASEIVARLRPECVAIESLFVHGDHPATAVRMAHARGVLMLCAARAGLEIVELPPREVKGAITGSGRASKAQMKRGVQTLLDLEAPPRPADVADAMALAVAGLRRARGVMGLVGRTINA